MNRLAKPRFDENWSADDVRKINSWVPQITDGLNGGLTFSDNMRAKWIVQAFVGPAASLSFATDLTVEPMAVFMAKLRNSSGAAFGVSFAWTFNAGQIVTTSFAGLSAGSYTVTLLVIEG